MSKKNAMFLVGLVLFVLIGNNTYWFEKLAWGIGIDFQPAGTIIHSWLSVLIIALLLRKKK